MSVNSTAPWLRESYSRDDGRRPKTVVAAAVALVATAGVNGIVTAFNIASLLGQGFDKSSLSLLITVAGVGALVAVGVPLWIARAALRGSVGARFWSIFFLVALYLLTIQGSNPWSCIGCLLALGSLVLLWMPASRRFASLEDRSRGSSCEVSSSAYQTSSASIEALLHVDKPGHVRTGSFGMLCECLGGVAEKVGQGPYIDERCACRNRNHRIGKA